MLPTARLPLPCVTTECESSCKLLTRLYVFTACQVGFDPKAEKNPLRKINMLFSDLSLYSSLSLTPLLPIWLRHDPEELHRPQKVLPASPSHFKSPACVCADPEGRGGQGGDMRATRRDTTEYVRWASHSEEPREREVKLEKENVRK